MPRTLIVGDVHGCFDELCELFDRVALGDDDVVISVGDLVDRGPRSVDVVRWFRARRNAVVLMGNHERKHVRALFSYAQQITRLQFGEAYAEAVDWMRGLPYFFETDAIRIVHAAMIPGMPLAAQQEEVLCGSVSGEVTVRDTLGGRPWYEAYTDPKPVAFGHHVVGPEPLVLAGRVFGLDTGACFGQRLTALVLPEWRCYAVDARADHWAAAKRTWQVPVLRTRRWEAMSWTDLDNELRARLRSAAPDVVAYLASVREWADRLRALVPVLETRIGELVAELRAAHGAAGFARVAGAHPARALLFASATGRLGADTLWARCSSPGRVVELATALGLAGTLPRAPAGP